MIVYDLQYDCTKQQLEKFSSTLRAHEYNHQQFREDIGKQNLFIQMREAEQRWVDALPRNSPEARKMREDIYAQAKKQCDNHAITKRSSTTEQS